MTKLAAIYASNYSLRACVLVCRKKKKKEIKRFNVIVGKSERMKILYDVGVYAYSEQ